MSDTYKARPLRRVLPGSYETRDGRYHIDQWEYDKVWVVNDPNSDSRWSTFLFGQVFSTLRDAVYEIERQENLPKN